MLKVIIADDERKVCQLIEKIINWKELGFEIIGVGHNGPEVYDLICENKPDVVITDIRMPGFDGLELIKRTKELGISTSFIIISGYRHFEYAQEALKYGVENYLLKPIEEQELKDTLIKIRKQNKEEDSKVENEIRVKKQMEENITKIHWHFINNIIFNNNSEASCDVNSINKEYGLNFRRGLFQAIYIKLDNQLSTEVNVENVLKEIAESTKYVLSNNCFEFVYYLSNSGVMCILNYSYENRQPVVKQFKKVFDKHKKYIESLLFSFNITIGIGSIEDTIEGVSISISSALDAIKCRITLGLDRIINNDSMDFQRTPVSKLLTVEKKLMLENVVETMDKSSFEQCICKAFDALHLLKNYSPCLVFEVCETTRDIVLKTLKEIGIKIEVLKSFEKEFNMLLDNGTSEKMIVNNIKSFVSSQLDLLLQEKLMQSNRPIRLAKQVILEHYMEAITLEGVAELIHMNASYLSSIFKNDTGINFSDYLINCRIEVAKELLKNTNSKMVEVAEKIGYTDAKYFSKLFKKVVGIKPSEYRKLYS